MSDEVWESHDRDTGAYCGECGNDTVTCLDCAVKAERARLREAVEGMFVREPSGVMLPGESSAHNTAIRRVLALLAGGAP